MSTGKTRTHPGAPARGLQISRRVERAEVRGSPSNMATAEGQQWKEPKVSGGGTQTRWERSSSPGAEQVASPHCLPAPEVSGRLGPRAHSSPPLFF